MPSSKPEAVRSHHAHAPERSTLRVGLLTASDSRTAADNEGGGLLRRLVEEAGFEVAAEAISPEEPEALRAAVSGMLETERADAVLVTGGTGLGPRDRTPEAIAPLFDRRLPGFGELFRMLSFQEIGPAAMLSRADAGVVGRALVFLLPGSPAAVELGMRRLIVPELAHAVGQLRRPGKHAGRHQGEAGHGG